jgi:glycine betaine/proline transport system ATP-binding protein
MDEPFSALDPLIRRQLQDFFIELSRQVKKTTIFITHDLDEAMRIGHRIAIMKDGRIVQVGTPEQIVMHPADPYVAAFVAGISRLKLVHARTIMRPISAESPAPHAPVALARLSVDSTLNQLIDAVLQADGQPVLITEDDAPVGWLSMQDLLRAVRGSEPL